MDNMDLFISNFNISVMKAMRMINKNARGIIYITDESDCLIGSVTDGDIRRWIIGGGDLAACVCSVMNKSPFRITKDNQSEGMRLMHEQQIPSIAVVDEDNHIVDLLFLLPKDDPFTISNALEKTPIIVMAGGKGTRLYPYTKILPKPLIPIKDVPVLERIFNRFVHYGAKAFYLSVNYRKEMIKSYFADLNHSYDIHYIEEDEPLGTAGSIRLITETFDHPMIVTNCDILVEADYSDILRFHSENSNDITVVSALKNTIIPYGVIHTKENGTISYIEEKPELLHYISTGFYVINPEHIQLIPYGRVFHMTDLVELMIKSNKRVGMYPINESSFLDMGEFAEMKRMEEIIEMKGIY